jgi:hypothetical protein
MEKPELHLVPPCVEGAIALYEKLTGRKSTPEGIAQAQKIWDDFQASRTTPTP